jgi:hypothetical protein
VNLSLLPKCLLEAIDPVLSRVTPREIRDPMRSRGTATGASVEVMGPESGVPLRVLAESMAKVRFPGI